jgi:hypothetical protein
MTLTQRWSNSWLAKAVRSLGRGLAGAGFLAATSAITAGCLDRPVAPAIPNTTNVYIGQIRQTGVDKIDLLFMIDNSISMFDKQKILADAVPVLVSRLITPVCVDAAGNVVGEQQPGGGCSGNSAPEFNAVENIHIGIITSSLGHHGSNDVCSDVAMNPTYDDRAELLPFVRPGANPPLVSYAGQGFLAWDPRMGSNVDNPHIPPAITNREEFITAFSNQVTAAGELGCGYEASLEAWYRFLVDDEPIASSPSASCPTCKLDRDANGFMTRAGVNTAVLEQRRNFLRRDSLLAIVVLTDENDCSINDEAGGQGWLVGYKGGPAVNTWRMPQATASCSQANNACCRPCTAAPAPGCPDNTAEGCPNPNPVDANSLTSANDSMNERCFNQLERFGVDLLYPVKRYVDALNQPLVDPRMNGVFKPNPLLAAGPNGEPGREKELVFFAGIVGVPWQDISTADSLTSPRGLTYLTADQIKDEGRWSLLVPNPATGEDPKDPFMIESIDPRPVGTPNPVPGVNAAITPTTGAMINPINRHEQAVDPAKREDLQFACTFPLTDPIPCTAANQAGCDCNASEFIKNSPLCSYPNGAGPDGKGTDGIQQHAKAYPGTRVLQVLQGFGSNSIVASICPKNVEPAGGSTPTTDPNYGYNPAVAAIVNRLKEALTAKCLPRPLAPETAMGSPEFGKVPCAVVEVRPRPQTGEECSPCGTGRHLLEGDRKKVEPAVREYLRNQGQCGLQGLPGCDQFCLCEIDQFTGADLTTCRTELAYPESMYGYCYIDPAASEASNEDPAIVAGERNLVASCPPTQQRVLRFLGDNLPARDGLAFIACIGAAVSDTTVEPADM